MEINEKLDIFYRAAIEAANGQSEEILEDYKASYSESLSEYEKKKEAGQQVRLRIAEEKMRREVNRAVSEQIMQMKKEYHDRQQRRKKELFAVVEEKISTYRKTPAYREFLIRKIKEAEAFAAGREMTVYLDPLDGDMQKGLRQGAGCTISVSDEPFGGGIKAVIPSANLLMDESFESRMAEAKEKFSF